MDTDLILSQIDGRPMYLQIMDQIKHRIALGDWRKGEKLLSIRELAIGLRISVITVKRAYAELEKEGVIVTQHGKGSFIAADSGLGEALHMKALETNLLEAARLAFVLGIKPRAVADRLKQLYEKFLEDRK